MVEFSGSESDKSRENVDLSTLGFRYNIFGKSIGFDNSIRRCRIIEFSLWLIIEAVERLDRDDTC